tara:strand:- start:510 stop:1055 length:546 start_codon:yes stop_codon:yes gene_type:complete
MKNNKLTIILSLLMLSTLSSTRAAYDMGIYQQNYNVNSDSAILILESGTEYKLKFKGLSKNIDESTLAHKDLPIGVVEIKHKEHKTMGSSTIHVVEVEESAPASSGYIHLVTYDGDGGDRVKHADHYIRTIVVSGSEHSTRREPVCGVVEFDANNRYMVTFKNRQQLDGAHAEFVKEGKCQ